MEPARSAPRPRAKSADARMNGGDNVVVPAPSADDRGVCVLCGLVMTTSDSVLVTTGLPRLLQDSATRKDGFDDYLKGMPAVRLHRKCRKNYTHYKYVQAAAKDVESESKPKLRSVAENNYSPPRDCLFCGKEIDFAAIKKMPCNRRGSLSKRVHSVETMSMQEKVMSAIEKRKSELGSREKWSCDVQNRVASLVSDFCAAEVKYHAQCHLFFTSGSDRTDITNPRGRPVGSGAPEIDQMFLKLCASIEESEECQFSLKQIEDMITKNGDELYCSRKWLKVKLMNHYGNDISITEVAGTENVLNFSAFVDVVLKEQWRKDREKSSDEKRNIVTLAARFVLEEIRKKFWCENFYPSVDDLADGTMPELLKLFLETIITTKKEDKSHVERKQQYIGQCVMLAARPKSYLSPLLLALSACLHREFGSKQLINTLNSLGACHSYHEVKRFVHSLTQDAKRLMEEPVAEGEGEAPADGFVQWVFDNADWLTATLDGHNTFHCLGGAEITTPARPPPSVNVRRLPLPSTAAEIAASGHFIPKLDYDVNQQVNGLSRIVVRRARAPSAAAADAMLRGRQLDALHLVGLWAGVPTTPSWSGFMKKAMVCDGVNSFACSSIEPTPFINQDPTDPETLYSALMYAAGECDRRKQRCCFASFDNGLFPKAVQIVASDLELKQKVVVRLGGFHSLMSFMGAIGHVMSGSGLDDLWDEIYAHNSVVHMMTGKAFARAVRAHFLTQEAVGVLLLDSVTSPENNQKTELCALHAAFLAGEKTQTVAAEAAATLWNSLEEAGERAARTSETGQLWWQYYQLVSLMRLFIRAERTGDWDLHLATTTAMEPLYYSAGHHLYARSTRLYVQTMEDLDGDLAEAARKGYFTVRRNSQYWSGVWTDMVVEQDIMRIFKGDGGPTGRGMTDSTLAQWVGTMPAMHKVSTALEKFCGVQRVTSEQHVDLRKSRVSRDQADRDTLLRWLRAHNPFDNSKGLRCLSTGVIGNEKVKCHEALTRGVDAMEALIGINFKDLKIPRASRVIPLSGPAAAPKKKKEDPTTESNSLFLNMCCLGVSQAKFREYLKYELCRAPPALFEHGMMRHNAKSKLVQCLDAPPPAAPAAAPAAPAAPAVPAAPAEAPAPTPSSSFGEEPHESPLVCTQEAPGAPLDDTTRAPAARRADGEAVTVVDGGYLLHVVAWPRPGKKGGQRCTYEDVCRRYVNYTKYLRAHGPIKVVFDGYVRWSTKCEEQRRRAIKSGATIAPDIDVSADLVCEVQREQFLGNTQNKSAFITLLRQYLETAEVDVRQAEADADVLIVETALAEAAASRRVRVVANDTDILAVLIARARDDMDITVVDPAAKTTEQKTFDIASLRANLGDMVHCVLPVHALSGCDTTSAIYSRGKKQFWDLLLKDPTLRPAARVFNEPEDVVDRDTLVASGERLYMQLYRQGTTARNLNELRFYWLNEMCSDPKKRQKLSGVDLKTVPFTSDAGVQHTLRSYLQVQQWLGVDLTATDWGWTGNDLSLAPLSTTRPYAPEDLLLAVSCGCKTGCKENSNCSCRKNKTHCNPACRSCRGEAVQGCTNTLEGGEDVDDFT